MLSTVLGPQDRDFEWDNIPWHPYTFWSLDSMCERGERINQLAHVNVMRFLKVNKIGWDDREWRDRVLLCFRVKAAPEDVVLSGPLHDRNESLTYSAEERILTNKVQRLWCEISWPFWEAGRRSVLWNQLSKDLLIDKVGMEGRAWSFSCWRPWQERAGLWAGNDSS